MVGWRYYRPTRPVYIVAILTGVCLGLFLGRTYAIPAAILVLGVVAITVAAKRLQLLYAVVLLLVGMSIGWWRGQYYATQIMAYQAYFGESVIVTGIVADDPGYSLQRLVEFHVANPEINGVQLTGKVRVRIRGASAIVRGDTVQVSGVLRPTIGTSRQGSISYGAVTTLSKNTSWTERLRKRFFVAIYSSLPEPQASLGLGYLVGAKTALPQDFATAMTVVGLTHIVAVSGYNLTIIIQSVKRLFVRISAFQTVAFSFALIAGFLVMTGWSPSIMRAAIISGFSLLAWYFGRQFQPLVLILLGAAITGFINPLYIWGDVGWYLSFLAFAGVLLVAPLVTYFLGNRISKNVLIAILIETLAAQLLTLPYIAMIFGRVSVISPFANLLVVPFIPVAMLLVFVTGLVGLVSPYLALWVAFPAKLLMTWNVWAIETLARIPWAQSEAKISPLVCGVLYLILGALLIVGWSVYQRRRLQTGKEIDWDLL